MVSIERQRGILYEWSFERSPTLTILNKETHETQIVPSRNQKKFANMPTITDK
jgi:hypothetical protein